MSIARGDARERHFTGIASAQKARAAFYTQYNIYSSSSSSQGREDEKKAHLYTQKTRSLFNEPRNSLLYIYIAPQVVYIEEKIYSFLARPSYILEKHIIEK